MSREIKFRGLKKYSREWIYGMPTYDFTHIFNDENVDSPDSYEVDPDTIGQFTGLTDKDGKEIYEGDIVIGYGKFNDVVKFEYGYFSWDRSPLVLDLETDDPEEIYKVNKTEDWAEVIGNIHEDKHLLK